MDGRIALITGSSEGLGKAMALAFAKVGAEVALCARREDKLEAARDEIAEATGQTVRAYAADVATADGVQSLWDRTIADFGRVDVLVNNAGTSQTGSFEEITDEVWQADLDLKLFAAIRLSRLAFPGMKERKWGRIINILNTAAKAPRGGSAPTAVSRAAGMALTKVLSKEGAPHNVLVNGLCTGIIDSQQWVRRFEASGGNRDYESFLKDMAEQMQLPMGRVGTAEEYANVACFLASDAGSYVNGTAINIDGGMSPVV
jgi:NAD(P)-dependent dehydrogenase (short-subunit alcohol dehydrogenase family)